MSDNETLPKPKSIYDTFETDEGLENEGVWFDFMFGSFKLAYSGNQNFQSAFTDAMKPYAEAAARGLLDAKVARNILAKAYSRHVVKGWKNVVGRDGVELVYTPEACASLFNELPRLFDVIRDSATNFANYRKIYVEQVVKN